MFQLHIVYIEQPGVAEMPVKTTQNTAVVVHAKVYKHIIPSAARVCASASPGINVVPCLALLG
jgi:hypothetical protein